MESEKHFSVAQVAELWGLSADSIIRLFDGEEGVLRLGKPESLHKRRRIILRIPESVLARVYREHSTKKKRRLM